MLLTDVLELQIFPDSVQAYYEALVDAKVKKDSNLAGSIETDWIVEIIEASEFFFDTLNLKVCFNNTDDQSFWSIFKMIFSHENFRHIGKHQIVTTLNRNRKCSP